MGATQSTQHSYTLETPSGSLRGLEFRSKSTGHPVYRRYTRIPFALPPTGHLRWKRPQPLPTDFSFSTTKGQPGDYTQFGPVCPQPIYPMGPAYMDNPDAAEPIENVMNEDCLYLNVWVPVVDEGKVPEKGWPVQVFIRA